MPRLIDRKYVLVCLLWSLSEFCVCSVAMVIFDMPYGVFDTKEVPRDVPLTKAAVITLISSWPLLSGTTVVSPGSG